MSIIKRRKTMPNAKRPRQFGKVSLTKEECYCGIPELYDIVAAKLGHKPVAIQYDGCKLCVTNPVMEQVFAWYENECRMPRMTFNQLWLSVGPKANLFGNDYMAETKRGFILEVKS